MKNLSGQVGVYRRPNINNNHLKLKINPLIPIGTEIGQWTVIENDLYRAFRSQTTRACLVRCQCGTERIRTYGELRCGRSPSCGCKSKKRNIETVWKDLLSKIQRRGWKCHLTLSQLKAVSLLPCSYCGKEPSNIHRLKYKEDGQYKRGIDASMEIRYSGLDRIDSSKGYIHGNVVPCCGECNSMKGKLPLDDFLALIGRIQLQATPENIRLLAATLFELGNR